MLNTITLMTVCEDVVTTVKFDSPKVFADLMSDARFTNAFFEHLENEGYSSESIEDYIQYCQTTGIDKMREEVVECYNQLHLGEATLEKTKNK